MLDHGVLVRENASGDWCHSFIVWIILWLLMGDADGIQALRGSLEWNVLGTATVAFSSIEVVRLKDRASLMKRVYDWF